MPSPPDPGDPGDDSPERMIGSMDVAERNLIAERALGLPRDPR